MQYLSVGGRLTLISSLLDALPTYMMFLFPSPVSQMGYHETKQGSGRSVIMNLKAQNHSLMLNWLCRYATKGGPIWKEIIRKKCREESSWTTNSINTPYGWSIWRFIRNLWPKMMSRARLKVGNDMKTSFWKISLIQQGVLQQHILCQQQSDTVA